MKIQLNPIVRTAGMLAILASASALVLGQGAAPGQGGAPNAPAAQGGGGRGRGGAPAAPAVPSGPVPRMSNGKPDLSGHWANPYTPNMANKGTVLDPKTRQPLTFPRQGEALTDAAANATGNAARLYDLPYTEWGLKQWKEYDPVKNGDYAGSCLPFGM